MKIDGINNMTGGYQGQGSSVSTTPTNTASMAKGNVIDVKSSVSERDAAINEASAENGSRIAVREDGQASNEQIRQSVEKINKSVSNGEAIFGIHDATNRVMIKIVDKETKEVIKEFPPEKTLDMIAKVWEMAGIMVDEKR